ncbi:hypothetical protein OO013_16045 [Mangrovivirga sp. M17]|uniref:3-oxoacyl-ACP synthase n=1 Tax=Mangrovivirga halotolerans TaxID=2993936 RepID=A0ABT3RUD1_9BACT|nr:hypothetical protein [Mangrovivirga halotolerans]MCX2745391.1 hypothetical protein [Mangrovivirga halotolerans]
MTLKISSFARIDTGGAFKNGELVVPNHQEGQDDFLLHIYKALGIKYGKFHKMDPLCKLAFLTAELLTDKGEILKDVPPEDIFIVIGNSSSSILSDTAHQQEIDMPSPAVFVYTLPNIMLGELCIKYKIMGENTCFQSEGYDINFIDEYIESTFKDTGYSHCIFGWVNADHNNLSAHLFLVSKSDDGMHFTPEKIRSLMNI